MHSGSEQVEGKVGIPQGVLACFWGARCSRDFREVRLHLSLRFALGELNGFGSFLFPDLANVLPRKGGCSLICFCQVELQLCIFVLSTGISDAPIKGKVGKLFPRG